MNFVNSCVVLKLFLLICLTIIKCSSATYKLEERYGWTQMDFQFPSQAMKDRALATGEYIPENALPVGLEHYGNRLFVTVPRWKDGVPSTLNYINTEQTISGSPELIPYPDLRSNAIGDCENGLQTVDRIVADKCGRLWVLDVGTIGFGNLTQQVCPYAVNVFDLATNQRIRRYVLRPEDTNANTFIANTIVDIGKSCDDAFAYFSDELGYGLIVYSWEQNKSWRFAHSYFLPDPLRGDFNVAGINFQWGEEGIFGLALSQIKSDGYRTLFFSPLASHREFMVSTRILRDESRVEDSYHDFSFLDERSPNGHTTSRVLSEDGIMLFNLIDQNSVGCWHSSMPYTPRFHGIVDRDDVGLVFPVDVKIDENQNVWVMSDRMPVFLMAELDYTDINFRIYTAPLSALIEGTVCDLRPKQYVPSTISDYQKNSNSLGLSAYATPPQTQYTSINKQLLTFSHTTPKPYTITTSSIENGLDISNSNNNNHQVKSSLIKSYNVHERQQPVSHIYTTQRVPKAYIFNQHNGVNFETVSNYATSSLHHDDIERLQTVTPAIPKATWYTSSHLW